MQETTPRSEHPTVPFHVPTAKSGFFNVGNDALAARNFRCWMSRLEFTFVCLTASEITIAVLIPPLPPANF